MENNFDGVFRFTNVTDEDFKVLWNNKEYTFPAGKTTPMIIQGETPENVQQIRKKFAYKLAQREFYKGSVYNTMKEQGRGLPPLYDEKVLEPLIESCLQPLPMAKLEVKDVPKKQEKFTSKAVSGGSSLNNEFKDEPIEELGVVFPNA